MVTDKQTVFIMLETSGDLVKRANLEFTHIMHSKLALVSAARANAVLAVGCM
jgi:hypothetical protein